MTCLEAQVLIIYGPIGSGKTNRAIELVENAREAGYTVLGLLSLRVIQNGETIGYDGLDLESNRSFSLVRLKKLVDSEDWESIGKWKYAFSKKGFKHANDLLTRAASNSFSKKMIIFDEYGHIELLGRGIYPGFKHIVETLNQGGKLVVLCRDKKVNNLVNQLPKSTTILKVSTNCEEFWLKIRDCFI
jgi:nucleoside-triphosphatase THEP1